MSLWNGKWSRVWKLITQFALPALEKGPPEALRAPSPFVTQMWLVNLWHWMTVGPAWCCPWLTLLNPWWASATKWSRQTALEHVGILTVPSTHTCLPVAIKTTNRTLLTMESGKNIFTYNLHELMYRKHACSRQASWHDVPEYSPRLKKVSPPIFLWLFFRWFP